MTWDQIDADWGGLWIRQQLQWIEPRHVEGRPIIRQLAYDSENAKAKPHLVRPKTKSSIAWLPLPQEIAVILKAHNARQSGGDDGLLFTTANGTPYSFGNVERSHEHFLSKAGFPKSRFHDLRHSCLSFLECARRRSEDH